jgi:hypothetical protein
MELEQVSHNCFAVLNEKNRVCDANSSPFSVDARAIHPVPLAITTQLRWAPPWNFGWDALLRDC